MQHMLRIRSRHKDCQDYGTPDSRQVYRLFPRHVLSPGGHTQVKLVRAAQSTGWGLVT